MRRGRPNISLQWLRLKASSISSGQGYVKNGELLWNLSIRPFPLAREYQLQIRYSSKLHFPQVYVTRPNLAELANGRYIPHVYSTQPVRLCLHSVRNNEWTSDKWISETIVPWCYLWLGYFEHWLATDNWLGGGEHPGDFDE